MGNVIDKFCVKKWNCFVEPCEIKDDGKKSENSKKDIRLIRRGNQ